MTRHGAFVLLATGLVVALLGLWMAGGFTPDSARPPMPAEPGGRADQGADLKAQLLAFDVVPLNGAAAAAFALPTLDGRQLALADLNGRPALLYFWATW
jgi:hypothetical protein